MTLGTAIKDCAGFRSEQGRICAECVRRWQHPIRKSPAQMDDGRPRTLTRNLKCRWVTPGTEECADSKCSGNTWKVYLASGGTLDGEQPGAQPYMEALAIGAKTDS
jgi:hypothetical protein